MEPVTENTTFTGSKRIRETPTWESCTSTLTAAVSVWRAPSLDRAVSTLYQRGTWACLMLGCTTVLSLHVDRYCLGKEQDWMLKVSNIYFKESFFFIVYFLLFFLFFFLFRLQCCFIFSQRNRMTFSLSWCFARLQLWLCLLSWTSSWSASSAKWPGEKILILEVQLASIYRRSQLSVVLMTMRGKVDSAECQVHIFFLNSSGI